MTTIQLSVPDQVFAALRWSPHELADELRLAAVIFWYSGGLLSQERAAQLAGLDRTDFIFALTRPSPGGRRRDR